MNRLRRILGLTIVLLVGCAGKHEDTSDFVLLSMEKGGFCPAQICWSRTTVTAMGEIRLEWVEKMASATAIATLMPSDLKSVLDIAGSTEFRRAVGAMEPTCPPVFDFALTFVLETTRQRQRDMHAAGCVLDEFKGHPYRNLRMLLDGLVARYFPEVPPR